MARAGLRVILIGVAAAGLLAGCVESGGKAGAAGGAGLAGPSAKKQAGTQDVEAPEVFQTTDSALWDGRPSLGGIWVAAPEVTNPERVIMFNPATGKSVTGALFKRERENPGPRLQLSSDAAEALAILAGQPTEIRVTALRKVDVVDAAPAEKPAAQVEGVGEAAGKTAVKPAVKAPAKAAGTDPAKGADSAKADEAAAIASAALAAVADGTAKPKAEGAAKTGSKAAGVPAAPVAGAAAVAADATTAVGDEPPRRKTWKERRAEAKAAREAKRKAAAEAKAAASAAKAGTAPAAGEAPTATPETTAIAPVESAPLDARAPLAASAAAAPKRKTVGETPVPAAETPAAKAAPAVASGPVRPIQVASFSKEDNARRAAEALAKIGVTATPQKSDRDGKAVWGVVVQGDDAMLKKIKAAGFADAFFLK